MTRFVPKKLARFVGSRFKPDAKNHYLKEDLLKFSEKFLPSDDKHPHYAILKQLSQNIAEALVRLRLIKGASPIIKNEFFMMELNLKVAKRLLQRIPFVTALSPDKPVQDITVILRRPEPNNQITVSLETRATKIESIPLRTQITLEELAQTSDDKKEENKLMADKVEAIGDELLQFLFAKMGAGSHKIHVHAASVPDLDILIAKVENRMAKDLPSCGGFFYSIADKSTVLKYDMCPVRGIKLDKELLPANQILISHTAQNKALSPLFFSLFTPVVVADCKMGENGFVFDLMSRAGVLLCDDYDQHASMLILE